MSISIYRSATKEPKSHFVAKNLAMHLFIRPKFHQSQSFFTLLQVGSISRPKLRKSVQSGQKCKVLILGKVLVCTDCISAQQYWENGYGHFQNTALVWLFLLTSQTNKLSSLANCQSCCNEHRHHESLFFEL